MSTTAQQIAELITSTGVKFSVEKVQAKATEFMTVTRNDTVVACLRIRPRNWYLWELTNLVVHPDYRRQGLGKALVQAAVNKVHAAGGQVIVCTTRYNNDASNALFENEGFEITRLLLNPRTKQPSRLRIRTVNPFYPTPPGQ